MECVIGHLGSLLRQPSNTFQNLAAQTRHVATLNTLISMWPDFERTRDKPRGSKELGDGYLLLGPKDISPYNVLPAEQTVIEAFFSSYPEADDINIYTICQWGHLQLPSEQVARSRWKELERCSDMARTDRNVKVHGLI